MAANRQITYTAIFVKDRQGHWQFLCLRQGTAVQAELARLQADDKRTATSVVVLDE